MFEDPVVPAMRVMSILTWVVAYLASLALYAQWVNARNAECRVAARVHRVGLLAYLADRSLLAGIGIAWLVAAWGARLMGPFWCVGLQCAGSVGAFALAYRYGYVYGEAEPDAAVALEPAPLSVAPYWRWPDRVVSGLTAAIFMPLLAVMAVWAACAARRAGRKAGPSPEGDRPGG